jgi:putative phosphoribosyl transferase
MKTDVHFIQRMVEIPADHGMLEGILNIPPKPKGLVIFAHGSGSSRFSTRNQFVADVLHHQELATLLFDLLTRHEEESRSNVFDIELLAERLEIATAWRLCEPELRDLPIGYFGASTGAAAALVAAARLGDIVSAIVSRGGRPDLAIDYLPMVNAPTLLIVGGNDPDVLQLNEQALEKLPSECKMIVVPDASHLFPEAGALQAVADHASSWFASHFVPSEWSE